MTKADNEINLARMLENIVLNDDITSLKKFLSVNGLPRFHAGALGNACLYGGKDKVRVLLDAGASFQFLNNYPKNMQTGADQRGYSLMIVNTDNQDISKYLSETERVEIVQMLMEYNCKGFIPSRTLIHAILNQCNPIKEFLITSGVRLSQMELTNLSDEKTSWYDRYDPSYSSAIENMDSKEEQWLNSTMIASWWYIHNKGRESDQEIIFSILEDLSVHLKEKDIRIYVDKQLLFGRVYWKNEPLHKKTVSILVKYGKMSQNLKNDLINKIISDQNIELLEVLEEEGWFLSKVKLTRLIDQSLHMEKTASMEWLINYRDHRFEQGKKVIKENKKVEASLMAKSKEELSNDLKSMNLNDSPETTDKIFSKLQSSRHLQLPEGLKKIKQKEFQDRVDLISVTFPDSLEVIGNGAFIGCKNLKTIRLGSNVKKIHENAFLKSNLKEIQLSSNNTFFSLIDGVLFSNNGTKLILAPSQIGKEYTIPEGVTDIAEGAFNENSLLEKIKFPSTLPVILAHYLKKCTGLIDIYISEGTRDIEKFAFQDCWNLKRILIPDSMVSIGFPGVSGELYRSVNEDFRALGKLSQYDQVLLLERIILKDTDITLEQFLEDCRPLTMTARALGLACAFGEIDIVKKLLDKGFDFSWNIDSLKDISSKEAFVDNYGRFESMIDFDELRDIDFTLILAIPDDHLDKHANNITYFIEPFVDFKEEETEESIQLIPNTERAEIALEFLNRQTPLFNPSEVLFYASLWNNKPVMDILLNAGVQLSADSIRVLSNEGDFDDMKNMEFRGVLSASDEGLFKMVIRNLYSLMKHHGLQLTIDPSIFNHKERLNDPLLFSILTSNPKSIQLLKNNISSMRKYAVIHEQIDILNQMEKIGWLKMPKTKDNLVQLATEECKYEALAWLLDLKNRTQNPKNENLIYDSKELEKLSSWVDINVTIKKNWEYERNPDETIKIISYVGKNLEIIVPDEIEGLPVRSISKQTFSPWLQGTSSTQERHRKKISKIYIPDGITVIEEGTFDRCANLTEIRLPETLKIIGSRLFTCCGNLRNIILPRIIETIEPETFMLCGLTQIDLPDDLKEIGVMAFCDCRKLTSINLPQGIERILKHSFSCCMLLSSVNLPSTINMIGEGAFMYCTNLTEIEIPENIRVLETSMFEGCIKLEEVSLSNGLEKIEDYVFNGCISLKHIVIPESVSSISPTAFCTGNMNRINQIIPKKLDNIVLKGKKGSYAEKYAIQYNFLFEEITS